MAFDLETVKAAARGHWAAVLNRVGGISDDYLATRHGPCPRRGGPVRWRVFNDFADTGGAVGNQCGKFADGIAVMQWTLGIGFPEALEKIGTFLGVAPKASDRKPVKKKQGVPAQHLEFITWSDQLVALWCLKKKPIMPDAIRAVGGRLAQYRSQHTVIAIPVLGPQGAKEMPVGWCLYNATGGTLPVFTGGKLEHVKVKLTGGSDCGCIHLQT